MRWDEFRRQALATENFPLGSWTEQRRRLAAVKVSTLTHARAMRHTGARHVHCWALLLAGLAGVLGDAMTTYYALHFTDFSESNLVAGAWMEQLGLHAYIVVSLVLSLLLLPWIIVRGPNVIAWLLFSGGVTFGLFKLYVALANLFVLAG